MSGLYSPVSEDSTVPQFEAPSPSHRYRTWNLWLRRIYVQSATPYGTSPWEPFPCDVQNPGETTFGYDLETRFRLPIYFFNALNF